MTETKADGYSPDLVPVAKIIPETHRHGGAIMLLRDQAYRMIIKVGSVNFEMQSSFEQIGTIRAFGALLDSLQPSSPIQIFCHTKRLDTEAYMRQFDYRLQDPNLAPLLRRLIEERKATFQVFVEQKNLLQREFYVVIGHKGFAEPAGESISDNIPGMTLMKAFLGTSVDKRVQYREPDPVEIDVAVQQLHLRAQNIESYMAMIGINQTRRLGEHAIIRLLSELYNPGLAEKQRPAHLQAIGQFMPNLPSSTAGSLTGRRPGRPLLTRPDSLPNAPALDEPARPSRQRQINQSSPEQRPVHIPSPTGEETGRRRRRMAPAPPPIEPAEAEIIVEDDDWGAGPPPLH